MNFGAGQRTAERLIGKHCGPKHAENGIGDFSASSTANCKQGVSAPGNDYGRHVVEWPFARAGAVRMPGIGIETRHPVTQRHSQSVNGDPRAEAAAVG